MTNGHTETLDDTLPAVRAEAPGVVAGRAYLMQPASFDEAMKMADTLSKTNFVPNDYKNKPGDVLCAIQFGAEIGLPPMQALQGIAVINGRPSVWGDAALAIVQASGTVDDFAERIEGDGETMVAICIGKRRGRPAPIEHRFSVADAKTGKLWGKGGPWSSNPRRMLQMRARAFVLRDGWADYLKGMAIREEAQDITPVEAIDLTPLAIGDPEPTGSGDATISDAINEPQRRRLFALAKEHNRSHAEIKGYLRTLGIDSTTRIPAGQYDNVVEWITGAPQPGAQG